MGRYRYVRLRWRLLFAAIDLVGGMVFAAVRALGRLGSRPARAGAAAQTDREPFDARVILLIQLDHMGDAVITSAMLAPLRRRFPGAAIEVLAGPWNRELFEAMPEVDRVHVARASRFSRSGRFGWMLATLWWGWRLRQRGIDLGIDVRGEFPHAVLLWLTGARRRLGWRSGGGGFLLTDSPEYVPHRPEVESRLALLATLGIRPEQDEPPPCPRFEPPEAARRAVADRLASLPEIPRRGALIALHVGAGTEAKRWPAEHWRGLVDRLLDGGRQVVLVGGPGDRIIARHVEGSTPKLGLWNWTGHLTVPELAALLERADLLVGGDSGPAHLAAAVGTPVVVLFSGTNNADQWRPRGRSVRVLRRQVACSPCHRQRCPLAGHPCMRGIGPEDVADAVDAVLRGPMQPLDQVVTLAGEESER